MLDDELNVDRRAAARPRHIGAYALVGAVGFVGLHEGSDFDTKLWFTTLRSSPLWRWRGTPVVAGRMAAASWPGRLARMLCRWLAADCS